MRAPQLGLFDGPPAPAAPARAATPPSGGPTALQLAEAYRRRWPHPPLRKEVAHA